MGFLDFADKHPVLTVIVVLLLVMGLVDVTSNIAAAIIGRGSK